jgi:undecaprenyl pyrophosphate phosphatase UppP
MRGLFYIFFTHDLFRRIDKNLTSNQKEHRWDFATLATFVVVLTISANILNRLSGRNIGSPFTDIAGLILVLIVGVLLLQIQKAINISCNDPEGQSNDKFTPLNYIWIVLGTAMIFFIFIGLFFSQEAPVY